MNSIGGNVVAEIQKKESVGTDRIGKPIIEWKTIHRPVGFLDLSGGSSNYTSYNAKVQDSTHIFICDWFPMNEKSQELRLVADGQTYDITLIDDPMHLNYHYEIYLRFVG